MTLRSCWFLRKFPKANVSVYLGNFYVKTTDMTTQSNSSCVKNLVVQLVQNLTT